MSTWDYISTGLGIGVVFAVVIGAWALIEWATNPSPSSRTIQSPRAHTRALAEANPPQPPPETDAWLVSHAEVQSTFALSQSVWDEVTSSSSTLIEGSAPALPDTVVGETSRFRPSS